MLIPEVVVNLLPKLGVRVDLLSHSIALVKHSSVPRNGSSKASPEKSTGTGAAELPQTIPKQRTSSVVGYAVPSQFDRFVALALQQHGQQSTLRKGRG
jgi:hypothetical protein